MPTRTEAFGIVYLETRVFGVPIVGTDLGSLPDLVDNGILVPVDDSDELARGIWDRPTSQSDQDKDASTAAQKEHIALLEQMSHYLIRQV